LTDRTIQAAKADGKDKWISGGGPRGAGRLYVRVQPSGRKIFYYRYAGPDGKRESMPLGEYIQKGGRAGLTLTEARDRAGELARLYLSGIKDLRGHLEAEQRARERAQRQADEQERREAEATKRGNLRNLLTGYVEYLERAGKESFKDVRYMFQLHVFEAFPELAELRANEIKASDLRMVLAKLIDAEKGRTAGKLRSYMRAAYATAIRAEHDPTAPVSMLGFGIEYNPCDALPSLSQFNLAGERNLNEEELMLYITALEDYPLITRSALLLSVYLGGQRPLQLARVSPADVDLTEGCEEIRIRDGKGARRTPRLHVVPLVGRAKAIVSDLMRVNGGQGYLLSNSENTHINLGTMGAAVREISEAMVLSERSVAPFRLGDVRRTCETMLSRLGIIKDIRAQLMSHGLGGVQNRNYDRNTYMDEKYISLLAWEEKLNAIMSGQPMPSNVTPIQREAA
jgi:integrase